MCVSMVYSTAVLVSSLETSTSSPTPRIAILHKYTYKTCFLAWESSGILFGFPLLGEYRLRLH
jgi:hypothetical protein